MPKRKKITVDCNYVRKNLRLHRDGSLTGHDRYLIRQHISECSNCQRYFEELLYTVNLLDNLPSPIPPDTLLDRINFRLQRSQRASLLDFLSYPVSRVFSALHFELKPIFVNSSAFLLYFIISLFIAKLFFSSSNPDSPHPTEPIVRPNQRVVTLAEIKRSALSGVILDVGDKSDTLNTNSPKSKNNIRDEN